MTISSVLSSAGTTDFLNIGFKGFGHVKMNYAIEMFEIKSHSQGGCGYDDFDVFVFELGDDSGFFFVLQSSMEHGSRYVTITQKVRHIIKNILGPTVNQHSLTFHNLSCVQILYQGSVLILSTNLS